MKGGMFVKELHPLLCCMFYDSVQMRLDSDCANKV